MQLDQGHPLVRQFVDSGFRIWVIPYVKRGAARLTVYVKHSQTGLTAQGWSKGGNLQEALADLAERMAKRRIETELTNNS